MFLQWVVLVAGAILTSAAAWSYSGANGAWQEAVRVETARSNAFQEQVRAVYGDEAPAAFRVVMLLMQTETLEKLDDANRLAASQGEAAKQTAFALQAGASPESLVHRVDSDGADVPGRLAGLIATEAAKRRQPAENPDALAAEGDAAALLGGQTALVTVLVTGLAVAAALRLSRRRAPLQDGDIELFPQPGIAPSGQRRMSTLLLTLWAAGIVLPLAQLALGAEEQRSQGTSARLAIQLTSDTAISLTRSGFQTQARTTAKELGLYATGRDIGTVYGLDPKSEQAVAERAVARAEERVALRAEEVAVEMGRAPRPEDNLPPRVVTALLSQEKDWKALGKRQNDETDRSELFGNLSNLAVVLIGVIVGLEGTAEWTAQRRARGNGR
ncbi:hypothetical protein [Streptosporangium sp. NPDC048865]|uniref:hypothetical protein n=1 Tax=Streptosporangium sp. NPDC048865 TaxID=3155766 RepID=UPI003418B71D